MNYSWKDIFRESAPLLTLMAFIGILGGQLLHSMEELLFLFPVFLFLLPVMNGLGGNIGAILGARASSGLHSGYISPNIFDRELGDNAALTLLMGAITYTTVGLLVAASTSVMDLKVTALHLVLIIVGAGAMIITSTVILTVIVSVWSYRKRLDPDNIVIPVITTLADFISILALYIMVWMVIP